MYQLVRNTIALVNQSQKSNPYQFTHDDVVRSIQISPDQGDELFDVNADLFCPVWEFGALPRSPLNRC